MSNCESFKLKYPKSVRDAHYGAIVARARESSRPVSNGPLNAHGSVSDASTLVPYDAAAVPASIPETVTRRYGLNPMHYTNTMDPTKFLVSEMTIEIENLAFCRAEDIAGDMKALFGYLSSLIPENWSADAKRFIPDQVEWAKASNKASGVLPGGEGGAFVFSRMADSDLPYTELETPAPNGDIIAFAKKRTVVVRTNCCPTFVTSLLRSDSLFVLPDWAGFHVCWEGLVAPREWTGLPIDDATPLLQHNVKTVRDYSTTVRGMGLRARHRHTRGLPCTSLRFTYVNAITL